jgi:hypothetical protein
MMMKLHVNDVYLQILLLAQIIIKKPLFALPAVDLVSREIQSHWSRYTSMLSDDELINIIKLSEKYLYGKTSFGRLNAQHLQYLSFPRHVIQQ